jgi:hypothetical protein
MRQAFSGKTTVISAAERPDPQPISRTLGGTFFHDNNFLLLGRDVDTLHNLSA